jgi:hypothetical protein
MNDVEARADFVQGLRDLADLYEEKKALPLPAYPIQVTLNGTVKENKEGVYEWNQEVDAEATKKNMKRIIRAMGRGKKEKQYTDWSFSCVKKFGDLIVLKAETKRDAVCRKVFTGNKIKHAASTQTYTTPERIEDEYEWVCDDPLLAAPTEA